MADPNLSEIVTTTLRNRKKQFADNVTNKNALLKKLDSKGKIVKLDGGRTIVKELDYAENGTFKYYSGYEALDISASDVLSAAEYNWKQAAVNVTISGLEQRQNSGSYAVLNLLDSRIQNAMRTMANNVSTGIYSDGTGSGSKQIDGLQSIVADSPSTGTVGGINAATYSFWRNYSYDATSDGGAAASSSNILKYMNEVYNRVARGNEVPDLIVADYNYFNFFEQALQANQRFTSESDGNAGFLSYKYKNADIILDGGSGISTNHMYFLNTDYLSFDVHKDAYMEPLPSKAPINQDALVFPIIFMGNLTCSNRARQGVLKD